MTMRVSAVNRRRLGAYLGLCALALPGCKSIEGDTPVLIPNRALQVSRSLSIPADTMVLMAGAFLVIDPLAPNWHVEALDLGDRRYVLALTKKRFAMGGDGESMQVFRRNAERIARDQGYAGYQVLEFSEGIESKVPVSQRVSRGVIQFL